MSQPPPIPTEPRSNGTRTLKIIISVVCSLTVLGAVGIFLVIHYIGASGITRPMDNKFGDQHLKTTVALVELYKTRSGRYPQSLRDLKFNGDWDQIALINVRYYPAPDGSKYCVEVARGWIGKPALEYPPEFWQGTGYSSSLCPHSQ